jgi:hypothetical protein
MSDPKYPVDVIYLAACSRGARLTRICVASIRYFYPDVPIKLLPGGPSEAGLAGEMERYRTVGVAEFPAGDYGWGFVKLGPLSARGNQRFLILNSDTVMTGPILDRLETCGGQFIVDRGDQTESRAGQFYWNPDETAREGTDLPRLPSYFNTSQWVGTSGVIGGSEFDPFGEWGMPRKLKHPRVFKAEEQGILNFVVNRLLAAGRLSLDQVP